MLRTNTGTHIYSKHVNMYPGVEFTVGIEGTGTMRCKNIIYCPQLYLMRSNQPLLVLGHIYVTFVGAFWGQPLASKYV